MGTVTLPELRMRRASSGAIGWSINGTKETLGAGEEPGARQAGTQPDCTSLCSGSVPTQHSPRPHQCSAGTQRGSCCPPGSTPAAPSIPHHPSTTRCRSVPTKTSRPLIPSCSGGPRPRAHRCHTQSLGRPAGAALLSPEQRSAGTTRHRTSAPHNVPFVLRHPLPAASPPPRTHINAIRSRHSWRTWGPSWAGLSWWPPLWGEKEGMGVRREQPDPRRCSGSGYIARNVALEHWDRAGTPREPP